jgi:hypothetical protein
VAWRPRRQTAAKLVSETEAWLKEWGAVKNRFGVLAKCEAYEASRKVYWDAFNRFLGTPAKTLAGMVFNTSAMLYFDDEAQYAWKGSVGDRQQLEQDQEILLELRRDLLRLAGRYSGYRHP